VSPPNGGVGEAPIIIIKRATALIRRGNANLKTKWQKRGGRAPFLFWASLARPNQALPGLGYTRQMWLTPQFDVSFLTTSIHEARFSFLFY